MRNVCIMAALSALSLCCARSLSLSRVCVEWRYLLLHLQRSAPQVKVLNVALQRLIHACVPAHAPAPTTRILRGCPRAGTKVLVSGLLTPKPPETLTELWTLNPILWTLNPPSSCGPMPSSISSTQRWPLLPAKQAPAAAAIVNSAPRTRRRQPPRLPVYAQAEINSGTAATSTRPASTLLRPHGTQNAPLPRSRSPSHQRAAPDRDPAV